MKTFNHLITCIVCLCVCTSLQAQESVQDRVLDYFTQVVKYPQEKVYVHTDRTVYAASERIWFRGYVVNAISHKAEDAYSNFINIELLDRRDSIVVSKKVKGVDGSFSGELLLAGDILPGNYYIRAYTNWMRNLGDDFFFRMPIFVVNSLNNNITTNAEYTPDGADKVKTNLQIVNKQEHSNHPYKVDYVSYSSSGDVVGRGSFRTDGFGKANVSLPYTTNGYTQLVLDDDKYDYSTILYPRINAKDFAVTFHPEGGDLLLLPNQIVAFKAQRADGYSVGVTGVLRNSAGEELTTLSTMCDGMGAFSISPEVGETYHAELTSTDGTKKTFTLPAALPQGAKITARRIASGIAYEILNTDSLFSEVMYVACHQRGMLRYMKVIDSMKVADVIFDGYLSDGIAHLLLLNKEGYTISERLVYVNKATQPQLSATLDKPQYAPRSRVRLVVNLDDTIPASLSISVTDRNKLMFEDTLGTNAQSSIWLTSDLKGYVENAGRYFLPSNKRAAAELNLLMLTHGWRRFDTSNLTVLPDSSSQYYAERGMTLTGRVSPMFGSPAGLRVNAVSAATNIMLMGTADDKGLFVLQGPDFPDSTVFTVRSRGHNDMPARITMNVDMPTLSKSQPLYPKYYTPKLYSDLAANAVRDKYYSEGGISYTHLREVEVVGNRNNTQDLTSPNAIYNNLSDRTYSKEWLAEYSTMNVHEILSHIPALTESEDGNTYSFRSRGNLPVLVINGIEYIDQTDWIQLRSITASEVERIDLIQYNVAGMQLLGRNGSGGGIIITLNTTENFKPQVKNNAVEFTPKGYNTSVQFYHPVYLTPTVRGDADMRTTLYWNPDVKLDEAGNAVLEFYTDDTIDDLQIDIEGITQSGKPLHILQ